LFLSSFRPIKILKGISRGSLKGNKLRASFVILQFFITSVLITSSSVIYKQIHFIKNKNIGYNRDQIVVIPIQDKSIRNNVAVLKNELLKNRNVIDLAFASGYPTSANSGAGWHGQNNEIEEAVFHYRILYTDYNFVDMYQMVLTEGRNFTEKMSTDNSTSIIVNKEFVKAAGWKNPVGKKMPDWLGKDARVIGVIKDFNHRSLHSSIQPLIMVYDQSRMTKYVSIRINSENIPGIISYIENAYKEFNPQVPFSYYFLDDIFNNMHRRETKMGSLAAYFSVIAIFIACIGMFGLASFNAERRTKEIGIRKVLGASAPNIFIQLFKEFIKWVIIANAVAIPIAYYAMNKWLQSFAYRTDTSIWIFVLSAGIALFIALLSVSFQSVKAATANPVDSLRYE
jgi:putative ABC transport system permease protein